jgi:hypothetical protein
MVATLGLTAYNGDGQVVARNFTHLFVTDGYPPRQEDSDRAVILRAAPDEWSESRWSQGTETREVQTEEDLCNGRGHGYFEWRFPLGKVDLPKVRRIRVLVEASSCRVDTQQTDDDVYPTTLRILLNSIRVYDNILRNHPHDSRGVLSYYRGMPGPYGYLVHALAEGDALPRILRENQRDFLRLRCLVPRDALLQGGLTIYGAESGRFPVCPTVIFEW